ncbi:grpE protein homolog 1, mitochondrial-like isoform X2 [Tripterygium wilfordii]|uniref:grpE protein homolog 1, mitochondrial-like isoform X2 n=1 Tax=Tripterygium wilfordii TaxID=458696 RepID=UPI0018F85DE2|nr:grpE protein homolog 1, mitochondrial-like isoform X2 [Tripterygium wilfordii]
MQEACKSKFVNLNYHFSTFLLHKRYFVYRLYHLLRASTMVVSRVLSSVSRSVGRRALQLSASQQHQVPLLSNQLHSLAYESRNKMVTSQIPLLNHSAFNSVHFQRFGMSSSATPQPTDKEHGSTTDVDPTNAKVSDQTEATDQNSESDSEDQSDLSVDDLVKVVAEKEELLKLKHEEIKAMQDKVLRSYAEMENVMERTRRDAENSKKFAIQNFAKSLLDVADNLERASSVVKVSFAKIDTSKDAAGAVPLLKTLLEGVEMTEKQLLEVFKKYGLEKYDPTNEPFDPHRHNAVFQVPDNAKPPGTVAHVLKAGYMLYDRVIRPAEVGVTQEAENDTAAKGSEA